MVALVIVWCRRCTFLLMKGQCDCKSASLSFCVYDWPRHSHSLLFCFSLFSSTCATWLLFYYSTTHTGHLAGHWTVQCDRVEIKGRSSVAWVRVTHKASRRLIFALISVRRRRRRREREREKKRERQRERKKNTGHLHDNCKRFVTCSGLNGHAKYSHTNNLRQAYNSQAVLSTGHPVTPDNSENNRTIYCKSSELLSLTV